MVSKELVGNRIKQARLTQRKTLKDVEALSGFSSTHISEIERGRTSPTIGALIRIAHALDKDPSFFIEERELEEVCVTTAEDRPGQLQGIATTGSGHQITGLTRGILGGRLLAYEVELESDGTLEFERLPDMGDLGLVCVSGRCLIVVGEETTTFEENDSIHYCVEDAAVALRGDGQSRARVVLVMDPKETTG